MKHQRHPPDPSTPPSVGMTCSRATAAISALFTMLGCAVATGCAVSGPAPGAVAEGDETVRNIIFLLADGAGVSLWTAGVYERGDLAVKRMPVVGLVDTRSRSRVTDSAAGATAYATGERVTNRTIGVGGPCPLPASRDTLPSAWPDGCEPLESWFTIARDRGKATGIVTTTSVIDATPAAFIAHSPSRYWREQIAEQFAQAELDVLLGGGRRYFDGATRSDGRDLLGEMCARSTCIATAAELAAYTPDDRPLIGLFTAEDMDDFEIRPVGLPDMVEAALARLDRDPRGFVAIFETEATDNAPHANLPLERITADILEFDRAVGVALDFASRTPGTLVIVTADHETGGLALVEAGDDFELRYTTRGHSAAMVPLFAAGAGAERFGGFRDNIEIGRMLLEIARGWE